MNRPKEIELNVKSIYNELLHDFTSHGKELMIMSHFGEFSQELVNSLSEGLESILNKKEVKKILTKRMFSIMIEGLQNIRLHGMYNQHRKQLGHLMTVEMGDGYKVSFGNIVNQESKHFLTQHLENLNSMNLSELKDYYIETLGNGVVTNKGGAGLGFTTIALKSKSKIQFQFLDFENDNFYFEMRVELV